MPDSQHTKKTKSRGCRRAALVALAVALIPVLAIGAYYAFVIRPYINWHDAYSTQMMFWQRDIIVNARHN